jgi:hypothetical protein
MSQLLTDNDNNTDFSEKQSYDRLMDGQDIRFKTEINGEMRSVIGSIESSIDHFEKKKIHLDVANRFLLTFIDMGASLDRKSRKETVQALVAKNEFMEKQLVMEKQQQNIMR